MLWLPHWTPGQICKKKTNKKTRWKKNVCWCQYAEVQVRLEKTHFWSMIIIHMHIATVCQGYICFVKLQSRLLACLTTTSDRCGRTRHCTPSSNQPVQVHDARLFVETYSDTFSEQPTYPQYQHFCSHLFWWGMKVYSPLPPVCLET